MSFALQSDADWLDGCTCAGASYASREVIDLVRDGKADFVARTFSALTVERAASALKACLRGRCACLGDHDDAVLEQLEAIVDEADREDEPSCADCRSHACLRCVGERGVSL